MENRPERLTLLIREEHNLLERQSLIGSQIAYFKDNGVKDEASFPHPPLTEPHMPIVELKGAAVDTKKEIDSLRKKKAWHGVEAIKKTREWISQQAADFPQLNRTLPASDVIFEPTDKRTIIGKTQTEILRGLKRMVDPENDPYIYYGLELLIAGKDPKRKHLEKKTHEKEIRINDGSKKRKSKKPESDNDPLRISIHEDRGFIILNGKKIEFNERAGKNLMFQVFLALNNTPQGLSAKEIEEIYRKAGGSEKLAGSLIVTQLRKKSRVNIPYDRETKTYRLPKGEITLIKQKQVKKPQTERIPEPETEKALPSHVISTSELKNLIAFSLAIGLIDDLGVDALGLPKVDQPNKTSGNTDQKPNIQHMDVFTALDKIAGIFLEKDSAKKTSMLVEQEDASQAMVGFLVHPSRFLKCLEDLHNIAIKSPSLLDKNPQSPINRTRLYLLIRKFSEMPISPNQLKVPKGNFGKEDADTVYDLLEKRHPGINEEITNIVYELYGLVKKGATLAVNQITNRIIELAPEALQDESSLSSNWATPNKLIEYLDKKQLRASKNDRTRLDRVEIALAYLIGKYKLSNKDINKVRKLIKDEFRHFDEASSEN